MFSCKPLKEHNIIFSLALYCNKQLKIKIHTEEDVQEKKKM
jgi:hypothetical protein